MTSEPIKRRVYLPFISDTAPEGEVNHLKIRVRTAEGRDQILHMELTAGSDYATEWVEDLTPDQE